MKWSVLGVPSSIGSRCAGPEKAPAALRAAGLLARLRAAGIDTEDTGDPLGRPFAPDPDPARRRFQNLPGVAAMAQETADRVEPALRAGRRVLILGGDCTLALGSLAGAARVESDPGLVYLDRDAELNTPRTTPSGILDGMVIAHLLGRGVPELARPGGRPPLLRPGRLALVGVERLDPPEIPVFEALPSLRLRAEQFRLLGPRDAAAETLRRVAAGSRFLVHLDLDVLDDSGFAAVDFPAPGGLTLEEVTAYLARLLGHENALGLEITNFNPDRDPSSSAAGVVVDLLVRALAPGGGHPA
jgi:arginase